MQTYSGPYGKVSDGVYSFQGANYPVDKLFSVSVVSARKFIAGHRHGRRDALVTFLVCSGIFACLSVILRLWDSFEHLGLAYLHGMIMYPLQTIAFLGIGPGLIFIGLAIRPVCYAVQLIGPFGTVRVFETEELKQAQEVSDALVNEMRKYSKS